jgi:nitroimidazol reductase NimA-like FMN-containing flavoprotein (pyridoxamine 5'-phosphate oxidase superfamily)
MGRLGIDDLADLRAARLDGEGIDELLEHASECSLVFAGPDGWPMGVVVSFVRLDGSFWFTAVGQRQHVACIRHDQRVSLVVTSAGTALEGRRMVAFRGEAIVHDDRPTVETMLHRIAALLAPTDPESMVRLLDTEHRVVVEVHPTARTASHDSRRIAGNGRGGGVASGRAGADEAAEA